MNFDSKLKEICKSAFYAGANSRLNKLNLNFEEWFEMKKSKALAKEKAGTHKPSEQPNT